MAIKSMPGGVTPDMAVLDPYAVGVDGPVGATGAELVAIVKAAAIVSRSLISPTSITSGSSLRADLKAAVKDQVS